MPQEEQDIDRQPTDEESEKKTDEQEKTNPNITDRAREIFTGKQDLWKSWKFAYAAGAVMFVAGLLIGWAFGND